MRLNKKLQLGCTQTEFWLFLTNAHDKVSDFLYLCCHKQKAVIQYKGIDYLKPLLSFR